MSSDVVRLIDHALALIDQTNIDVFTFAVYHDHESRFLSICVDTEENSERKVQEQNRYNMKHFFRAFAAGSPSEASLWQANVGRNLSLGDFSRVNLVEMELPPGHEAGEAFYASLVLAVKSRAQEIAKRSSHPEKLLFCCSTEAEEVGLVWALESAQIHL